MAYVTLSEFKAKVEKELDLENEVLVQPTEFVGYVNDGARQVAAEMSKLGMDDLYYHSYSTFPLAATQSDYSLPTDILANKIVEFVYDDGVNIYPLKRLRGKNVYTKMQDLQKYATGDNLPVAYMIFNQSTALGYKLKMIPTPTTSHSYMKMYYIRQAEQLSLSDVGTGLIDCPEEFIQFLVAFVKVKCLAKEIGNPMLQMAMQEEDRERKLMVQTLTDQVQDTNNTIPMDLSHYMESV